MIYFPSFIHESLKEQVFKKNLIILLIQNQKYEKKIKNKSDIILNTYVQKNINMISKNETKKHRKTYTKECIEEVQKRVDRGVIYGITFGEDALIISSKTGVFVYSLHNLKLIWERGGQIWDAVFIPGTKYVALVQHDGSRNCRRRLQIVDISNDRVEGEIVIKSQIEEIRASNHCIALSGIDDISIVHFPTLKPIYHGRSGTGIRNNFDISFAGLTLAHDTPKKGQIIIHNFTTQNTSKIKKPTSMSNTQSKSQFRVPSNDDPPRELVTISAHKESICLIRLSPNGSRVATASNKGTMIRIFLTKTGKLWQQLRVAHELLRILDISFYEEGNVLACLNQKNMVFLYNVKLQPLEELFQTELRGHKIYQQKNPKSIFSFLSFAYRNLSNQYAFAYFKLVKPQENTQKKEEGKEEGKQTKQIPIIKQEQEDQIIEKQEKQEEKSNENSHLEGILRLQNQSSVTSVKEIEEIPQKRTSSFMSKKNSIMTKKKQDNFVPKVYNTVSRVHVGGNNTIWVLKGYFLYVIKYDPFHGGEMYHLNSMPI